MNKIQITKIIFCLPYLVLLSSCTKTKGNTNQVHYHLGSNTVAETNIHQGSEKPLGKGDLIKAARDGNLLEVKRLVSKGANINETIDDTENQITPLIAALVFENSDVAEFLIRSGANFHSSYSGYSASDIAVFKGQYELNDEINKILDSQK